MNITAKNLTGAAGLAVFTLCAAYLGTGAAYSKATVHSTSLNVDNQIKIHGKADRNGYGHLYLVSASGKAFVVRENVPITPKKSIEWNVTGPSTGSQSFGKDRVIFVTTHSKISGFAGDASIRKQYPLDIDESAFRRALRAKTDRMGKNEWTVAEATVVTAK
ncbi:hypothetical protein [Bradyrhizobium lablabi]|uniref:hypothetical protein n=1 Tax=Bradyrhizobium lablabi TaxID=722472 RepID=UPI001BA9008D|nr:hypothetical protein [Bradyrhizobium lablabi]MBR0695619.1 hypothetical protein [Bradyrhizobium lablabi]